VLVPVPSRFVLEVVVVDVPLFATQSCPMELDPSPSRSKVPGFTGSMITRETTGTVPPVRLSPPEVRVEAELLPLWLTTLAPLVQEKAKREAKTARVILFNLFNELPPSAP
jgi:hypothetical protein